MQFEHRGIRFDTDQMTAFPTGLAWMPHVYVNENALCAIEIKRAGWETPKVRYINRSEAFRLADSCPVLNLRDFLTTLIAKRKERPLADGV